MRAIDRDTPARASSRDRAVLTALCGGLTVACAAEDAAQVADRIQGWRSDIKFLQAAVTNERYVYKHQPLPDAFKNWIAELQKSIERLSDEQVFAEWQRAMTTLGDGHCYVAPSQALMQKMPLHQLPVRLFWFSDGLFVIDADPGYK